MARKPNVPCVGCGKLCHGSHHLGAPTEHWCQVCRRARRCGTTNGYRKGCRCGLCTEAFRVAQLEYRQRRRQSGNPTRRGTDPSYSVVCEYCGGEFRSQRRRARFCSLAHAQWARRDSSDVAIEVWAPPMFKVPSRRWRRRPSKPVALNGTLFVYGRCTWCNDPFMGLAADWERRSLYCSKRCAKKASGERRGKFFVPPSVRRAIYERDGWVCQLCMEPVDPDATDIWRASLDHIVPQSHVHVPDHSPSNLRLAHMWCNAVRGDERYYTAADLAA